MKMTRMTKKQQQGKGVKKRNAVKKKKKKIVRPIKVKVRLFNFPTIEIDEWDFTEGKEAKQAELDMLKEADDIDSEEEELRADEEGLTVEEWRERKERKRRELAEEIANSMPPGDRFCSGKSCLFPMIPLELVKAIRKAPLRVQVHRTGDAEQAPRIIGSANIVLGENFIEAITLASTPSVLPVSAYIDGPYDLKNVFGEITAIVYLYVRISCFGNSIFTQFKLQEGEEDYHFKMSGKNVTNAERVAQRLKKGKPLDYIPKLTPIFTGAEDFKVGATAHILNIVEPELKPPINWHKKGEATSLPYKLVPTKMYKKPQPLPTYSKVVPIEMKILQQVIPGFGRQVGDSSFIRNNPTLPKRYTKYFMNAEGSIHSSRVSVLPPVKSSLRPGIKLPCQYGSTWSPLKFPLANYDMYPPLKETTERAIREEKFKSFTMPTLEEAKEIIFRRTLSSGSKDKIDVSESNDPLERCTCSNLAKGIQSKFKCDCVNERLEKFRTSGKIKRNKNPMKFVKFQKVFELDSVSYSGKNINHCSPCGGTINYMMADIQYDFDYKSAIINDNYLKMGNTYCRKRKKYERIKKPFSKFISLWENGKVSSFTNEIEKTNSKFGKYIMDTIKTKRRNKNDKKEMKFSSESTISLQMNEDVTEVKKHFTICKMAAKNVKSAKKAVQNDSLDETEEETECRCANARRMEKMKGKDEKEPETSTTSLMEQDKLPKSPDVKRQMKMEKKENVKEDGKNKPLEDEKSKKLEKKVKRERKPGEGKSIRFENETKRRGYDAEMDYGSTDEYSVIYKENDDQFKSRKTFKDPSILNQRTISVESSYKPRIAPLEVFLDLIKCRDNLHNCPLLNAAEKKMEKPKLNTKLYACGSGEHQHLSVGHENCIPRDIITPKHKGWMWDYWCSDLKRLPGWKALAVKLESSEAWKKKQQLIKKVTKPEATDSKNKVPDKGISDESSESEHSDIDEKHYSGSGISDIEQSGSEDEMTNKKLGDNFHICKEYRSMIKGKLSIQPTLHLHKKDGIYTAVLMPSTHPLLQGCIEETAIKMSFDPKHPDGSEVSSGGDDSSKDDNSTNSEDSIVMDFMCPLGMANQIPPTLYHSTCTQTHLGDDFEALNMIQESSSSIDVTSVNKPRKERRSTVGHSKPDEDPLLLKQMLQQEGNVKSSDQSTASYTEMALRKEKIKTGQTKLPAAKAKGKGAAKVEEKPVTNEHADKGKKKDKSVAPVTGKSKGGTKSGDHAVDTPTPPADAKKIPTGKAVTVGVALTSSEKETKAATGAKKRKVTIVEPDKGKNNESPKLHQPPPASAVPKAKILKTISNY